MVARNAWTSNSRPFLKVLGRRDGLRVVGDAGGLGIWRAIFVAPLDLRDEDMKPPLAPHQCMITASHHYTRSTGQYENRGSKFLWTGLARPPNIYSRFRLN